MALGIAAVIPAVCVLWFMTRAMRNERLAVEQQLTSVYTNQLATVQRRLTSYWHERLAAMERAPTGTAPIAFATIVRSNLADAVVVCDEKGRPVYPSYAAVATSDAAPDPEGWTKARELEFQKQEFTEAAKAYREIASQAVDPGIKARALLAQANCLAKGGDKDGALATLFELAADNSLATTGDSPVAAILPNAQLRFLKLLNDPSDARFQSTLDRLVTRLNDYGDARLLAPQRRFLMEQVVALVGVSKARLVEANGPDKTENSALRAPHSGFEMFPTLAAERLAAEYLETVKSAPAERLQKVPELRHLWHARAAGRPVTAVVREDRLHTEFADLVRKEFSLPDASIELIPPGSASIQSNPVLISNAGDTLPGWSLAILFTGSNPFDIAARRQFAVYLWTGLLVVASMTVLAFVIARNLRAQMRLARLKNELVSTVSHELKTPLASMRALVDTLLAGRCSSPEQANEYLRLIAKENQRLSHLIENFLTFSRLERGRHRFRFEKASPADLAHDAVDALSDRLHAAGCHFTKSLQPNSPSITADPDAMTTVLVNLLDNACKYTGEEKHIHLSAHANGRFVCFEVRDNGIGLSGTEVKRVFKRFYQVDQSLTRERGGCGLGLSIVQSVVRAHNGTIEVESTPGRGSVFRVRIPMAGNGKYA